MNIDCLFLKPHDGSSCGRGMCARDDKCSDIACEGHPLNAEAAIRSHPVGVESALPITYTGPEPREPMSGEAKVLIAAVALTWVVVLALSFPDAINSLWPQLVAALSPSS